MKSDISFKKILITFIIITVSYFGLYFLNNNFQLFSATSVPVTIFDHLVEFKPTGVYIYSFAYILPALVFFRLWQKEDYPQIIFYQCHFMLTTILANLIFLLFPTTLYNVYSTYSLDQLLQYTDWLTASWLKTIYYIDRPYNCLPSLHVASAFVSAMALHKDNKWLLAAIYLFVFWICLSTMQVKQHHFYDVVCGFLLSLATFFLLKFIFKSPKVVAYLAE